MHTMHHRKAVTTALSSGAVLEETDVPKRRRKRPTGSSSHNGMVRNDLLIAVAFTCVLTVIAVLVVLKIYAILTRPADTTFENGRSVMAAIAAGRGNAEKEYDPADVLPWNTKYIVPGSMAVVGDRSDAYIELRQKIDAVLPLDAGRSLGAVQELLTTNTYAAAQLQPASQDDAHHNSDQVPYDIHDCPATPPQGYPFAWNMLQVLDNWGPDDTNPPASGLVYQGLCVFDYQTDYDKALTYRNAELPFVVVNDPAVAATVERWNRPGYMPSLMGGEMHRTEYSENNHFMYYVPVPKPRRRAALGSVVGNARVAAPPGWKAPTVMMRMPYAKWLQHANVTDDKLGPSNPHWYYRLIGCGGTANDGSCDKGASEYLFDELTFFQPRESLYIVEPEEQKGYVRCR